MNDIKQHIRLWAFLTVALLLAACTADDPSAETGNGKSEVHLMPYMQTFHDADPTTRRALPTGYESFEPTNVMQMVLYLAHDEQIPLSTLTYFPAPNDVWNSSVDLVANEEYKIYGFMPRKIGSGHSATYQSDGIDLTLNNLPPLTDKDLCVITGVLQGSKDGDISTSDIVRGKFDYTGKSAEDGNYIYLLLDHIYASLDFQFKVDANYSKLRTIKLKEVKLTTTQVAMASVTLNIRENNNGDNPMTINWASTSGTYEHTIYNSDSSDGTALTTSYVPLATAQFAPVSGAVKMTMTCTYDVYTADGKTVVSNRTAVNDLTNIVGLTSGQKRKIKISVNPTYLYVLADPDLDNPTISID